jgi:hypothetical protein
MSLLWRVPNWSGKRRHGREQLVGGDIEALGLVGRLLNQYAIWRSSIDQMGEILAEREMQIEIDAGATAVPAKPTTKEDQA